MMERETFRPGGMELTRRMLELANFQQGARVLDVCCGEGATVEMLRRSGFDAWGVDLDPGTDDPRLVRAPASCLPFEDASLDGILCECSFSLLEPDKILLEFARVLKTGGALLLSDLYSRSMGGRAGGLYIHTKEAFEELLERYRFELQFFEDHTDALKAFWARQIMEHGGAYEECDISMELIRPMKCGYCFFIARKLNNPL